MKSAGHEFGWQSAEDTQRRVSSLFACLFCKLFHLEVACDGWTFLRSFPSSKDRYIHLLCNSHHFLGLVLSLSGRTEAIGHDTEGTCACSGHPGGRGESLRQLARRTAPGLVPGKSPQPNMSIQDVLLQMRAGTLMRWKQIYTVSKWSSC